MDLNNLKAASTITVELGHPATNTLINRLIADGLCVPNDNIELADASDGVSYLERGGRMLSYNDSHLYVSASDDGESKAVFLTGSNDELKLNGGTLFGGNFSGFNVTCYAPTSLKYRSAVMKIAKKYADVDSKKFIDMDDNEIDQALTKSTNAIIDTVSEVVTGCNLVMAGEDLTVEQFKSLIKKEEYYWLVAQVKGELDAGKLIIKQSAAS